MVSMKRSKTKNEKHKIQLELTNSKILLFNEQHQIKNILNFLQKWMTPNGCRTKSGHHTKTLKNHKTHWGANTPHFINTEDLPISVFYH